MGQKSKASQAHLGNLRNCVPKTYHAPVEDTLNLDTENMVAYNNQGLVSKADAKERE